MYHSLFIHSSVDGPLGCSHVLAFVNSAAVNIRVHVSFSILVSSGYTPGEVFEKYRFPCPVPDPLNLDLQVYTFSIKCVF